MRGPLEFCATEARFTNEQSNLHFSPAGNRSEAFGALENTSYITNAN